MQPEKFTMKTQAALQGAQSIAQERSHQEVDGEHLLLALVQQEDSLIPPLLQRLGVNMGQLSGELVKELDRRPKVTGTRDLFLSNYLKRALDAAEKEAQKMKDEYLSTEHLLLGLLEEGGPNLKKLFQTHKIRREDVLKVMSDLRGNQRVTDPNPEDKFQALEKYGRDLTAAALNEDPQLGKFSGRVSDSGEGRWTIKAAIDEGCPAPVLSSALLSLDALDTAGDLERRGSTAFDIDAAVMVAVDRLRAGVVGRNLTTPSFAIGDTSEIELEREVRAGVAWGSGWPGNSRFAVSLDGDLLSRVTPFGDRRDIAGGVETWWWNRTIALRGGARRSTVGAARGAITGGVSYAVRPSIFVEGHVAAGERSERGWSVGVRAGF